MNRLMLPVLLAGGMLLGGAWSRAMAQESLPLSGTVIQGVRVVNVQADRRSVRPLVIVAAQGEPVRLVIHSRDVIHGLRMDVYGLNVTISAGATTQVDLRADQSGQFALVWDACCSQDWPALGQLVVLAAQ